MLPTRLLRYVLWQYLQSFAVCLGGVVGIYLVIDFADRARAYSGPHVARDVALLYLCKAAVVGYQMVPAAALLAAGACASTLRKRGETTAMAALTVSPRVLHAAVGLGCLLLVGGAIAADQAFVGRAGQRADQLTTYRFRQWGDYSTYYGQKQWFRGRNRVYFLRQGDGDAFEDVSIFNLTPDFRLAERVDALRMEPLPGGAWRLVDGSDRTFEAGGRSWLDRFKERFYRFDEDPSTFQIRRGHPEQMPLLELARQVGLRRRLGLGYTDYVLALHNKLAYPLLGLPAALLAASLALRRGRKGHLTASLVEGVAVVAVLWGASVVFKSAAGGGQVSPVFAAWAPLGVLSLVSAAAVRWLP